MNNQQPVTNVQLTPESTKKPPLKWIIIFLVIVALVAAAYLLIFQFKINLLQLIKPSVSTPAPNVSYDTTINKKETVLTKFSSETDFKNYLSEGNKSSSGAYFGSLGFGSRNVVEIMVPNAGVAQDT